MYCSKFIFKKWSFVIVYENGIKKSLSKEETSKVVTVSVMEKPALVVKLCRLTPDEIKKYTCQSHSKPVAEAVCSPIRKYSLRGNTSKQKSTEILSIAPKRPRTEMVKKTVKPKFIPAIKNMLKDGMIVLAWMRTFFPWPAKILKINKTTADVYFFGDHTKGTVQLEKIGTLSENAELIKFKCLNDKKISNYKKAVKEVERINKIPSHLSVLEVNVFFFLRQFSF